MLDVNANYDFGSPEELIASGITLDQLHQIFELALISGITYQKYLSVLDPNYAW